MFRRDNIRFQDATWLESVCENSSVPEGRLKMGRDAILDKLQPSMRDLTRKLWLSHTLLAIGRVPHDSFYSINQQHCRNQLDRTREPAASIARQTAPFTCASGPSVLRTNFGCTRLSRNSRTS